MPDADLNLPEMKTKSPSCPAGGVHMYVTGMQGHTRPKHLGAKYPSLKNFWSYFLNKYSYFHLSENKIINVFPVDYIVQLSKLTSQWANKYLTLRFNK